MKIALDISQLAYQGGVAVYWQNLLQELIRIDQKNQYLFFGTSLRRLNYISEKLNSIKTDLDKKLYPIPPTLTEILFNKWRIVIEMFTGKIDLLHTNDWLEPRADCPKVTTVHDLAPIIMPKFHHPKIVAVFRHKLELVKKETSLIISVSKKTKQDLIERLGIKPQRIKVIYEALNKEFALAKTDNLIIKKYNLDKFIISDAFINSRKNLSNLIKAFDLLADQGLKLVLFGEALWDKEVMIEKINQSPMRKNIVLTGKITIAELKALYKKAQAAVFPSLYEGFGLPVLEAMHCGCPVMVSNNSSYPELVGKAGILVDPNDPEVISDGMVKILNGPSLAKKLSYLGFGKVKQFNWQKTAQETINVYEELY